MLEQANFSAFSQKIIILINITHVYLRVDGCLTTRTLKKPAQKALKTAVSVPVPIILSMRLNDRMLHVL